MRVLEQLEPKDVFYYFEELCGIPHGSGNTKAISDYCVEFAKKHGFTYYQEPINNVIIVKEATAGYENSPAIILQGHLDMVCEKTADSTIDFEKDGLKLMTDGDWVTADGTTLGADNGIAIAMALAILADDSLEHPKLEALFTVDEETGMFGAEALEASVLTGKKLMNLDSEEEGVLTVSCAGGVMASCQLPVTWKSTEGLSCKLRICGLLGGHSGIEIHKQRGNANQLLGRILYDLSSNMEVELAGAAGGSKDNVITKESYADLVIKPENLEKLEKFIAEYQLVLQNEYKTSDPGIQLILDKGTQGTHQVLDEKSAGKCIFLIQNLPNGVQAMSADIEGLVETSLNMGVLSLGETKLSCGFAVRSSVKTAMEALNDKLVAMTRIVGGEVKFEGFYPPWEYKKDSAMRETMLAIYKKMYGEELKIEAIHAGLECGLLSDKIPGLDCVSIGPNLESVHSTEERVSAASVAKIYEFVKEVLKASK